MPAPPTSPFERTYTVTWADIDANRHMRNTAYSDYCSHTRFAYLAGQGYTLERMAVDGIGPVVFRETTEYARELHLDDTLVVTMALAGASSGATRWRIRHELYRQAPDGTRTHAATLTLDGAWINLEARRIARPPPALAAALEGIPHTDDFEPLPARR